MVPMPSPTKPLGWWEKELCPSPSLFFQAIWGDSLTQGGHLVFPQTDPQYTSLVTENIKAL